MKFLKKYNGEIIDSDIGFDSINGWSIPNDVQSVEFEDGTVLINKNFDLESVKAAKISELESKVIDLQIRKDASVKAGVSGKSLQIQIDALKADLLKINSL